MPHPSGRGLTSLVLALTVSVTALSGVAWGKPTAPAAVVTKLGTPRLSSGDETRDNHRALPPNQQPPLSTSTQKLRESYDQRRPSACATSDFTSRTGAALVQQIKSSATDCVNTLFSITGNDAHLAFQEPQMISVANALRDNSKAYPGDNSTSTAQLVLYLRAGYYVHYYNPTDVGAYGTGLTTAIRAALDTFFGNTKSGTVSDANGQVLAEAVTLIDNAAEDAHYLPVIKRVMDGYTSAYDNLFWMRLAVNNTFNDLYYAHQYPEFVAAVQSDPSVLDSVNRFAINHIYLLGTDKGVLTTNAGRELARFVQYAPLQAKVRPLLRGLLDKSSIQGATAQLWVGIAGMVDYYDKGNCSYYDTCDLQNRLAAAILPVNYTCSASIHIRAQELNSGQLATTCTSLRNQDAYFHGVVRDHGPVADDNNTTIEVVVFHSSTDYQTYAGVMFGIDTNNGGMYLEGDPAAAGNQPRFVAYEAEWLRPAFQIWNLNHEYTHYLDGRFDMYGDFTAATTTPTIWWVEGFAEYVSYSYRDVPNTAAMTEAGKRTYALRTLFDTEYGDVTRVYQWGYLAVRYMLQFHRADIDVILGYYRTGNYDAARSYLTNTIGTRYDNDWYTWLSACSAGNCGGGSSALPECSDSRLDALGQNCARSNRAVARADDYDYLYVYTPAGTASLKITTSGGTGNCDLLYNPSTWATNSSATQRSTNADNNESLTVVSPGEGFHYVSLHGRTACSGVTVSTEFP